MITIAYHTLGCKVNQYETEKIREMMEQAGFTTVSFNSRADAYVINTCSVTSVADSKSRAAIRKVSRFNPDAFIVVTGCYAELEPDLIQAIEGVDLVVSNDEKETIPERVIARFLWSGERKAEIGKPARPRMRTRAVVKVQDGCDQFCSYCVIPYARSHKISRPMEDVLAELRTLAEFGYKEVVLSAIRLGAYSSGSDRLPDLIRRAAGIDGIERIRLSSIEPWEVNDTLLDAMESPKVCRHLHIPLQSGDDDVLHRMNRPYDSREYLRIIANVRKHIEDIGITTDVIVGFPGESDESFENTCRMIEEVNFSRLHVFRYSSRPRTRAALMRDRISAEVKRERAEKLIESGNNAMRRFAASLIGKTLAVLVESESKLPNHMSGFADNYVEVNIPGDSSPSKTTQLFSSLRGEHDSVLTAGQNCESVHATTLKGKIVRVKITGIDQDNVIGVW